MKLIFLHGAPASGKFTIAQELQKSWGVLNFHNHLTVEVAKTLFDFGTPEFWDLTHRLRLVALAAKARDPTANVAFTNCYSRPHDDVNVAALERVVEAEGGEFCPVFLACGVDELRCRIGNVTRVSMNKLNTISGLEDFLARWNCVALERPNCITVRTENRSAADCAEEIALCLSLRAAK